MLLGLNFNKSIVRGSFFGAAAVSSMIQDISMSIKGRWDDECTFCCSEVSSIPFHIYPLSPAACRGMRLLFLNYTDGNLNFVLYVSLWKSD